MDIKRLEFMITYNCSGRCRHCSVGDKLRSGGPNCIDTARACEAVERLTALQSLESLMTFGGEPLLYIDTVCAIHKKALDCGVPIRQIITNGYFSKDSAAIKNAARKLKDSGANKILISVDAFHQETIPVNIVRYFAESLLAAGIEGVGLHPAWVVNREHNNEYNKKTRQVLAEFSNLDIPIGGGNDIFIAGNARKHLARYYGKQQVKLDSRCGELPYTELPDKITCLSIAPNGDVIACSPVIGNIYRQGIDEIIGGYDPYKIPVAKILLEGGMPELISYVESMGFDTSDCYDICDVCRLITSVER